MHFVSGPAPMNFDLFSCKNTVIGPLTIQVHFLELAYSSCDQEISNFEASACQSRRSKGQARGPAILQIILLKNIDRSILRFCRTLAHFTPHFIPSCYASGEWSKTCRYCEGGAATNLAKLV